MKRSGGNLEKKLNNLSYLSHIATEKIEAR
jgi:hypothetical protein